jgi:hypothetical protein
VKIEYDIYDFISFKVHAVMEVTEIWNILIPSEYVTVTKCYCVVQKHLFRSMVFFGRSKACIFIRSSRVHEIILEKLQFTLSSVDRLAGALGIYTTDYLYTMRRVVSRVCKKCSCSTSH